MANTVNVCGQDISVFYKRGFVDDCQTSSQTEVWAEGGGGYVGPYASHFRPVNIRSNTTHTKEVRLTYSDNARETVKFGGDMTFVRDDDVSLFYACPAGYSVGNLVGVANHTEDKFWTFGPPQSISPLRTPAIVKRLLLAATILFVAFVYFVSQTTVFSSVAPLCLVFSIGALLVSLAILVADRNMFRTEVGHAIDAEIKRIMQPGARQWIVRGKNVGVETNALHAEKTILHKADCDAVASD
jgi:hypothetical protein